MKVARSSFYYNPKARGTYLVDRIEAICVEFPRYVYRRVSHQLKHEGWAVNHKKGAAADARK